MKGGLKSAHCCITLLVIIKKNDIMYVLIIPIKQQNGALRLLPNKAENEQEVMKIQ